MIKPKAYSRSFALIRGSCIWLGLLCLAADFNLRAQLVPDRFVVELQSDPKSDARTALVQKDSVRRAIEDQSAEVTGSVDAVMNALLVRGTNATALRSLPGVKKVYPVYEVQLELDRAPSIHNAPAAWTHVGGIDNAGRGARIAVFDTGLDPNHPGFQDDSLTPPEGFPKGNRQSDLAATNKKIIVARSYEDQISFASTPDPRDYVGHGTALAMVAAGVRHSSPVGEISGIAPKAFLGNYKVFANRGRSRTDVIIRAMDDAVRDGMDVINFSFGTIPSPRPEEDALSLAVENIFGRGILVVKSAGNAGPDAGTGSTPAGSSLISVGATWNDRVLGATATVAGTPILGLPPGTTLPNDTISGPLADVSKLDRTGLACEPLPADSLQGQVALILRGSCFFEVKLNNAQSAGAIAALIYTNNQPVAGWDPQTATLPALMITNEDGTAIKELIGVRPGLDVTIRFALAPFPVEANRIASFSSRGPGYGATIGPDMVAVGQDVFTAAQKEDASGEIYDPSGYSVVDGTSFSSPMVAGGGAALKVARPRLTPPQYKSLLVNTSTAVVRNGVTAPVQQVGAGLLDLSRALRANATVSPVSLSFGGGGPTAEVTRELRLTNIGPSLDTFSFTTNPIGDSPAPQLSSNSLQLPAGDTGTISVRWSASGLAPGEYQGFLIVRSTQSDVELRVPYWFGVESDTPRTITIFPLTAEPRAGGSVTLNVRVNNAAGLPISSAPQVVVTGGGGTLLGVRDADFEFPGVWQIDLRLGVDFGVNNTFRITAGTVSRSISIAGN